ncbi:hypothetical protein [Stutzerimonas stutzeri]|uniref:Lipoprotein n=1 Tax=Stutzerimonas stutzeri TaxID=316 RepID=A0AA42P494_STUST|nr:hypothetical protein [Stutzerimonas stutzeri]MDH1234489.1 hypothetical protein [Stutzerimonas stutzeri]
MRRILVVAALLAAVGCGPESPEQKAQRAAKTCVDSTWAWTMSQRYVRNNLKSPSSAKFAALPLRANLLSGCTHEVVGEFEAQNSFGAMIKQRFSAKMTYDPANNTWKGEDLSIF